MASLKRKRMCSESASLYLNYLSKENGTLVAADSFTGIFTQSTQYTNIVVSIVSATSGILELQGSFLGDVSVSSQIRNTVAAVPLTVYFPIYFPYSRVVWNSTSPPGNTSLQIYCLFTRTADVTTLAGTGLGDEGLVVQGQGPSLVVKDLCAGTNVTLSSNADCITIDASGGGDVTLSSAGGTVSLVNDGVGPALATKGLTAGAGISLTDSATSVTINQLLPNMLYTSIHETQQFLTLLPIGQYTPIPMSSFHELNGFSINGANTVVTYNGLSTRVFLVSSGYATNMTSSGGLFLLHNGIHTYSQYVDGLNNTTTSAAVEAAFPINPGDTIEVTFQLQGGSTGPWMFSGCYLNIVQMTVY